MFYGKQKKFTIDYDTSPGSGLDPSRAAHQIIEPAKTMRHNVSSYLEITIWLITFLRKPLRAEFISSDILGGVENRRTNTKAQSPYMQNSRKPPSTRLSTVYIDAVECRARH